MMKWILRRRIAKDQRGSTVIEMAFFFPIVMILLLGGLEFGRYLLLHLKLEHVAQSMADLVTRDETITQAGINGMFSAVQHIVRPFSMGPNGTVIVSGVSTDDDATPASVYWQSQGAGSMTVLSQVGATGANATLPTGFVVRADETVVVAEVIYSYQTWLTGLLPSTVIRKQAYYRPRLSTLQVLSP